MSLAVCTLFEKTYHFGVAALSNSLYKRGFRGSLFAGYRGDLPKWASGSYEDDKIAWNGCKTLLVADGMQIHFLPLTTEYLFANYKAEFMLQLFDGPAANSRGLVYFDPDIAIKCNWEFFESWVDFGVALVHEVTSNDMPSTHPIRKGWEKLILSNNRTITSNISSYLNSGFCGVTKENKEFLKTWTQFMEIAIDQYGFDSRSFHPLPREHIFFSGDQDAFNIAAMCSGCPISEIGPEAMDFIPGGWIMSHATWRPKTWDKKFIKLALKGYPPTRADRAYFRNIIFPLNPYETKSRVRKKLRIMKFASLIGRFYRRF